MPNDTERSPDLSVDFSIKGRDFNPDECSMRIGREPTRIWHQKREALASRKDLANTAWTVSVGWMACDSIDQAVSAALDEVWPHRKAIDAYVKEHGLAVVLECSVRIWSFAPLYNLTLETMRRLVALQAEFALGLYDYRDDDEV